MTIQIGIGVITGQVSPMGSRRHDAEYRDNLTLVRAAERLGFDSVWVSEHHGTGDGYLPSLLVMLASFAAVTSRMKLGTAVVATPLHHPLRLAEDAAVVDLLAGGRLVLGLGLGWREEEFRMFGVSKGERAKRTEETVEIMRLAWSGQRFSYHGELFQFDEVCVSPPPAQHGGPAIFLGGSVKQALRRVGRLADGYIRDPSDSLSKGPVADIRTWREHDLQQARSDLELILEVAREHGRDATAFGFAQLNSVFVSNDRNPWKKIAPSVRYQVGSYRGWESGSDTPGHGFRLADVDEGLLQQLTICGSPDVVLSELRPFATTFGQRANCHLIVRFHFPGMDLATAMHSMEMFAKHVSPALKSM